MGHRSPITTNTFREVFSLITERRYENLPDDKILYRLKDLNCVWLLRPTIAISEMASPLKDNWDNIRTYKGTVFTEEFIEEIQNFVDPVTDSLHHLDNKDQLVNKPPDTDDVLDVLKAISDKPEIEDLFINAFNATGPILMMAIHHVLRNRPQIQSKTKKNDKASPINF